MKISGHRFEWGDRLIVLGAVLGALVFYTFMFSSCLPFVRERGRRTQCLSNLKQIGLAINLYKADYEEQYPTNVTDLIKYSGGDENGCIYMCPSRTRLLAGKAPTRISEFHAAPQFVGYEYLSSTSSVPGLAVGATIEPVICDKAGNHGSDGINILFADGHAA